MDEKAISELTSKVLQNISYINQLLIDSVSQGRGTGSQPQPSEIEKQLDASVKTVDADIKSKGEIVKQICAALHRVSDDTFEIAKIVAPILITFSISRTISVPAEPFTLALIAMSIGRMGVAAMCPKDED